MFPMKKIIPHSHVWICWILCHVPGCGRIITERTYLAGGGGGVRVKSWGSEVTFCDPFCLFVFHSHALTRTCFPGMYWVLPWECSCPEGGIICLWCQQMVWLYWLHNRDSMPNWYTINHPTTLHTHNETQWPTTARGWHFVLRDVSCRQSWHLLTPSHPWVPPEWPYCQQAQCGHWFTLMWSIADLLTLSQPPICLDYWARNRPQRSSL